MPYHCKFYFFHPITEPELPFVIYVYMFFLIDLSLSLFLISINQLTLYNLQLSLSELEILDEIQYLYFQLIFSFHSLLILDLLSKFQYLLKVNHLFLPTPHPHRSDTYLFSIEISQVDIFLLFHQEYNLLYFYDIF